MQNIVNQHEFENAVQLNQALIEGCYANDILRVQKLLRSKYVIPDIFDNLAIKIAYRNNFEELIKVLLKAKSIRESKFVKDNNLYVTKI